MQTGRRIRVLVVDDDEQIREAYRRIFERHPEAELVGEVPDGAFAADAYAKHCPDVVLMDLQMPQVSGIDATRQIIARWPDAVVVAMTTFGGREYVVGALRAGASGYLLKDAGAERMVMALSQALAGEMPLSASVRRELVSTVVADEAAPAEHDLAPREHELVRWLAHGLTNAQIATRMHLSEGSVKQYVARIGTKLGVVSRTQILVRSIQLGIVDPANLPPIQG
ncbi:response regulator [Tessaracoccus caeni]|uniref:response regulator n=1 Tax=Tessaracoccus caeni TaxID=3031239 RepID=UPI0023D9B4D2|nr:response regulator transcription factor [Tessaracoccus caeni]MDF1487179.1 response regulator transcription factor [Tessaracoccus caeni]